MTNKATFLLLLCCAVLLTSASYNLAGGQYIAILGDGDIDDFGWNANVNAGRVAMEQMLNISGTRWVPNVHTTDILRKEVDTLVAEGVRVIICTSYSYGSAVESIATKYPNITFAQYGVKSDLPNLSDIVFSSLDYYFIIGVFCGMTTITDKVGIIFPGLEVSNANIANVFFNGVKFANPNLEVHIIMTGTYDDPDREAGAADILINKAGVGSLVGQTNGLTVPKAAMNAGFLAVGVTGFSLASIFGQQIGVSFIHNWATALFPFAAGINGTIYKKDWTGSWRSGDQQHDTVSHFVTADQWAPVNISINNMKKTNYTYLCGPTVAELGPLNPKTGCLNATSYLNSFITTGFVNWGNYTVPLTEIKLSRAPMIGLVTTAAFLIALTCVLMLVVFAARKRESIRLGSYVFLLNMLVGTALVYGGVIAWPLNPDTHSCLARVWLPSLGGTIAISALIAKNLRIMIAFSYAKQIKKVGAALLLRRFMAIALVLVLGNLPFLIAFTVVVPKGASAQQGQDGLGKYEYRMVCASSERSTNALYALLAYHGFQLLIGCIISYKCRIITDPKYDERKAVAFCLYGIAFCLVVFSVLVGIIGLANDQLVIGISLALLLVNTFSVVAIFGAKIVDLYVGAEVDMRLPPSHTNSQSMNASSNVSPSRNTGSSGVSSKEDSSLSF